MTLCNMTGCSNQVTGYKGYCRSCGVKLTANRKAAEKRMAREGLTTDRADGAFVIRGEAGNILASGYRTLPELYAALAQ